MTFTVLLIVVWSFQNEERLAEFTANGLPCDERNIPTRDFILASMYYGVKEIAGIYRTLLPIQFNYKLDSTLFKFW